MAMQIKISQYEPKNHHAPFRTRTVDAKDLKEITSAMENVLQGKTATVIIRVVKAEPSKKLTRFQSKTAAEMK